MSTSVTSISDCVCAAADSAKGLDEVEHELKGAMINNPVCVVIYKCTLSQLHQLSHCK